MQSQWFELKNSAVNLRKKGLSIGRIEKRLGIPRSTLSGWFKNVEITPKQKALLLQRWRNGLVKARQKASKWHRAQKKKRLLFAKQEADQLLDRLNINERDIIELALAMLYLGEGVKAHDETALGNSDPMIMKAFVHIMIQHYGVDPLKMRCSLYLRADQDPEAMKRFWSRTLKLPMQTFNFVNLDQRTKGSKTFSHYKGVCMVGCGNVAIMRKLLNISNGFCERILKNISRP